MISNRTKIVASCRDPFYEGFATKKEVIAAKKEVRGHYWFDAEIPEYVAFTPKGMQYEIVTEQYSPISMRKLKVMKSHALNFARLVVKGKIKEAEEYAEKNNVIYETI